MRVSEGGVSVWFGTTDAPAPSGVVAAGGDTSVTVGLEPPDAAASVTVLYRINHGPPHTVAAPPTHHDAAGKQYFRAQLSGFKSGDKVEYVALYRSGTRQIPSNQEAESHVVTFTVGPASNVTGHPPTGEHGPVADDPKETLRAVLKASHALGSAALEDSFIKLYFSHSGDAESFWKELEKHSELKAHIEKLQFALQIDLLTSGHLPLIEALIKRPGVKSMHDLAELDESVWHELIAKSAVPHQIPGASHEVQTRFYASSIVATLQAAFPTVTVQRIAARSHHVDPLAVKFLENLKDFDIRSARVDAYADEHTEAAFKGIAAGKREGVLKEVKKLQRLFSVSTNADAFRGLLETKLDSAHAVALIPRATFVSHYGHRLGGAVPATAVHERAQFINARNIHLRTSIHDAIHTPPTRGLGHHSQAEMVRTYGSHKSSLCAPTSGPRHPSQAAHLGLREGSLKEDLVKRFPNSEELFGSISLCNCEECESAIGPAAYLVDVLDFLGVSKPNEHHATPLDVLIGNPEKRIPGRRPDLAFLNLTCANTNTAMPYIDIVNEILESYVALGLKLEGASARDSADSTSAELDANPQYINQRAYEILDSDHAVYPFTLPFNRPLLVARSYLNQLGTSRHEILKTFHKDHSSPVVKHLLASEILGVSAEEFLILTGHHFDPKEKAHPRPEEEFYGYGITGGQHDGTHAGSWTHELANVAAFLQRTGISYGELSALVSTRFISPDQPTGSARELLQRIPVSHSVLSALLKSNLSAPADALIAIQSAGISAHDLNALKGDNFDRVAKMVVIDDAGGKCDPGTMKLTHFDGAALDAHTLGRMHRFIRLYRKTGWSITDLDRAISAVNARNITAELLVHVAHIKQLQERFHITNLQVLLAVWAAIETRGADSLFRGLFLNKARHHHGVDPAFDQNFPDDPVLTDATATLLIHLPILQSALRVTDLDMGLILRDCGFDPSVTQLNLANVSALYRRSAVAKALKMKIRDFLSIKALSGIDPFHSPEATIHFATLAANVTGSGLTSAQLSYVVRHLPVGSGQTETEPRQAIVLGLARDLRDGLTAIARDNAPAPDPNGSLTAQKLALLFDSSVVDDFAGIVNGTVNYSAPLLFLPSGLTFPLQLAKKIAYDPNAQSLTCKSPLTSADRSALSALSNDTAYLGAIESLYQQPIDLIKAAVSSFLDSDDAQKKLVTESPSLDGNLNPVQLDSQGRVTTDPNQAQTTVIALKYDYILRGLLPYLIVTLGVSLLKRTISESLKITDLMALALLDSRLSAPLQGQPLLGSRLDHTKTAANDLHSLQSPGLSAAYYVSADRSGPATNGIDSLVAFDGSKELLPKETKSASWSGMVAPTGSGDFEFIVRTNGTPALWVDDSSTPVSLHNLPLPESGGRRQRFHSRLANFTTCA